MEAEISLDKDVISKELQLTEPDQIQVAPSEEPELEAKAAAVVLQLLEPGAEDVEGQARSKAAVEALGIEVQKRAALQSEKLKEPVRHIFANSEDGSPVAAALIELKIKVEELDPVRFDFEPGWFTRLLGYVPGVGTPLKRYFSKYESAQTVIAATVRSLELGREQLKRDNITLTNDQQHMRTTGQALIRTIKLAQLVDQKLQAKLVSEISQDDARHRFISDELLFPVRQRIIDLQQQLAVNQQGVLAMELIIRNNKELIRGVNRALSVTVNALRVAVTVALALADQKIVLEKVGALSETTSDLIAHTAKRLQQQGVEIHKAAASAQLDMEALKSAFADLKTAIEDIAAFRRQSLPTMAANIQELDRLTAAAETAIKERERAEEAAPIIPIEVE